MTRSSLGGAAGAEPPRLSGVPAQRFWQPKWLVWLLAPCLSGVAIALNATGILQGLELATLDTGFRWRPVEAKDPRIVVVTVGDADVTQVGQWPLPDQVLAQALRRIRAQRPRVIGLDLYRDLPVPPGGAILAETLRTTPNLIGVEKRFGSQRIPPPPILAAQSRVASIDMLLDPDGRARRGLLAAADEQGKVMLSLAADSAVRYLQVEGVKEFRELRLNKVPVK